NRARCLSSNIVILRTSLGFDRLVDARCPVTLSPGGGGSHGQGQNHRSVAAVLPASSHTCPPGVEDRFGQHSTLTIRARAAGSAWQRVRSCRRPLPLRWPASLA